MLTTRPKVDFNDILVVINGQQCDKLCYQYLDITTSAVQFATLRHLNVAVYHV